MPHCRFKINEDLTAASSEKQGVLTNVEHETFTYMIDGQQISVQLLADFGIVQVVICDGREAGDNSTHSQPQERSQLLLAIDDHATSFGLIRQMYICSLYEFVGASIHLAN